MIKRNIYPAVIQGLKRQAAVALIGPRQVGKTTLALDIAEEIDAIYLDLEAMADREKLRAGKTGKPHPVTAPAITAVLLLPRYTRILEKTREKPYLSNLKDRMARL